MPDLSDGLSAGDEVDFDALLAKAVGQEPPAGDTPGDEPPASTEEPPAAVETPTGDEPPAEGEEDPEVAAYLARYGGDETKALRAAVEAQRLIGRQGNDLGAVRQELETLKARFEDSYEEELPDVPSAAVSGEIEAFVERVGGRDAANWTLQNRPDLYEQVIDSWADQGEKESRDAMRFDNRYQAALAAEMAKLEMRPEPDPRADKRRVQETTAESFGVLRAELGDEWEALAPHVQEAIKDVPTSVQQAIASPESVETQTDALRVVVLAARARQLGEGGKAAAVVAAEKTAAKRAASLAGGSLSPSRGTAKTTTERDEAVAAFKASIVDSESTSIAENITYASDRK